METGCRAISNRKNDASQTIIKKFILRTQNEILDFSKRVSRSMLTEKSFRANDMLHDGYAFHRTIEYRKTNYRSFDQILSKSEVI